MQSSALNCSMWSCRYVIIANNSHYSNAIMFLCCLLNPQTSEVHEILNIISPLTASHRANQGRAAEPISMPTRPCVTVRSPNRDRDTPTALRFLLSKFGLWGNRQKEQMIMFYYLTELLQLSRQSVFYLPAFKVDLDQPLSAGETRNCFVFRSFIASWEFGIWLPGWSWHGLWMWLWRRSGFCLIWTLSGAQGPNDPEKAAPVHPDPPQKW